MSIRCTPFCRPCEKNYKHHELLVALLNTRDLEHGFSDESDHELLKKSIDKYKTKGWDYNTEIPETNEEFRFPLLHWACVLGKIRTVRWLLDNGFRPTVQTKDTLETCVHRALVTLPDISSTKSGRLSTLRFETILPYLRDCLSVGNHRQNTPLHVAAQFMVQNKCYTLYENLFLTMLTEIKKMRLTEQHKCLNAQNGSGDTVINLLASGCKSLTVIEKLLDAGADSMIVNKLNIGPLDNAQRNGLVHTANFLKSSVLRGCGLLPSEAEYRKSLLNEDSRKRRSERRSTYYSTMSSLNMFCQGDTNDLNKSLGSQQLSSPSKGSEKSNRSNEADEEHTDVVTTEDEETFSQSSHISSSILHNVSDNNHTPVATGHSTVIENSTTPLENTRALEPLKESTPQVKHDDDDLEMCTCCGVDNDSTISIATDKKNQDKADSQVKLFDVMKEAGVLPDLADVIAKTKDGHMNRMKTLEASISEMDEKQVKRREKERSIQSEIARKKREIEKLNSELYNLRRQKVSVSNKRKLMEEESQDLRKKLVCCETLLKTVPKDNCN